MASVMWLDPPPSLVEEEEREGSGEGDVLHVCTGL